MAPHPERELPGVDAWLDQLLELPTDAAWYLLEQETENGLEQDVEARLAIGNGAFGMRASLEQPALVSRPATLIAGLFETQTREPRVPALVATPDWLRLSLWVRGERVEIDAGETLGYWRALDLRQGMLLNDWQQRTPGGVVVRVRKLRLACLTNRALALQVARITVDDQAAVRLQTDIRPARGLQPVASAASLVVWQTPGHSAELAIAFGDTPLAPGGLELERRQEELQSWSWLAAPGRPTSVARLVTLARASYGEHDAAERAVRSLRRARRQGLTRIVRAHVDAWGKRWAAADVEVDGDSAAQKALRFGVYHLVSAANPDDDRVSIGARGLTGEGYLGHVFWDTEIFLLPFYTLTWPEAARALLMYRYHTLPAAREKAARLGYRGALYAWESADTGEEATPPWAIGRNGRIVPILCGTQEQHISADIAYAVSQYWQATRDVRFLLEAGAEIILETARFWASRATLGADGWFHIRGVIGPDEYHETVDDNAYTNGLAAWNLDRGVMIAAYLGARWPAQWAELSRQLNISESELTTWSKVAQRLASGFDPATGLVEQFSGFFDLEDVDLRAYASRAAPLDVVLGPERTRRSQVIKQADVLMLLALLPDEYDRRVQLANFRYYEPRCGHGSSLSPAIHAWFAARVGEMQLAERYFRQAATIDLEDARGDIALGVHLGGLGGLWQAAVLGFGGLSFADNGVRLDPRLPPSWRRLAFCVYWRGRQLRFEILHEPARVSVWLERGRPLRIQVRDDARRVARDAVVVWQGEEAGR